MRAAVVGLRILVEALVLVEQVVAVLVVILGMGFLEQPILAVEAALLDILHLLPFLVLAAPVS
jgi:hypothetical protein